MPPPLPALSVPLHSQYQWQALPVSFFLSLRFIMAETPELSTIYEQMLRFQKRQCETLEKLTVQQAQLLKYAQAGELTSGFKT